MSSRQIVEHFRDWSTTGEALVLATVVETDGSTYSKSGTRMILRESGEFAGLVSGGCLEGDLAEHANEVFSTGAPKLVEYDLRTEEDELWGMAIGCRGLIRILLQRLDTQHDYAPFTAIADTLLSRQNGFCITVTESTNPELPAGATIVSSDSETSFWQVDRDHQTWLKMQIDEPGTPTRRFPGPDGKPLSFLISTITPWPRLLLLGAGPDAAPIVNLARGLGWSISLVDHRAAQLENPDLDAADEKHCVAPADLADTLNPADYSAAVVMSHNLDADKTYLHWLAAAESIPDEGLAYIGLLGPAARRERLLEVLDNNLALRSRLHGPVGLDIGANSPESIALALLAEIHAVLLEREGGRLSQFA
ncbi:MAG: XdhC family protein [Gammaproteobacteria bacterium]